jgi:hypothetical protein
MVVKKLSVALDEGVAEAAAQAARRRGVSLSAWLNRAAVGALRTEDGLVAVEEWEAEHGRLTPEELADADQILDAALHWDG